MEMQVKKKVSLTNYKVILIKLIAYQLPTKQT